MANKVIKGIKKIAKDVANEGKHQLHHVERNISSTKAKQQKLAHKQKAIKLLNKGLKDLECYKDKQGIVGEVVDEIISDMEGIIENAHGNNKNELLLSLGKDLLNKTDKENRLYSTSELLQTRKMENTDLKIIYELTQDICKAFCEILE